MKIKFENKTDEQINKEGLEEIAEEVISKLGKWQKTEAGLHLVDDAEIQKLNKKYRDKDEPTDVLSFPLDKPGEKTIGPHLLGDIFISIPTAKRNAKEHNSQVKKEIENLFIHGLLHLLYYSHETNSEEWDGAISKLKIRNS